MTNLVTALSRIDPAAGLVNYVTDIKPFHSKILDVQIEYVYKDIAVGSTIDVPHTYFDQFSLKTDVTYACGFGEQWDNKDFVSEYYSIVRATVPTEGSDESNSFVIAATAEAELSFFLYNSASSTLKVATPYAITASNSTNRTFTVTGNLTGQVTAGDEVGVNIALQSGDIINTVYTVSSVVINAGNTILTVSEVVPNQLLYPGTINIFTPTANIPKWILKPTKVTVRSTGSLPQPFSGSAEYYIHGTEVEGEFILAKRRYPQTWDDYVHALTLGTGELYVKRIELFQPSDKFTVSGSTLNRNDGQYSIKYIVQNATTITIYVNEPIKLSTASSLSTDGAIYMDVGGGYDDTNACELATAPDLFAQGKTYEGLSFKFDIVLTTVASGEAYENPPSGGFSTGDYSDITGFDAYEMNHLATTIMARGDFTLTPAGFDSLYFDVSEFDLDDINR